MYLIESIGWDYIFCLLLDYSLNREEGEERLWGDWNQLWLGQGRGFKVVQVVRRESCQLMIYLDETRMAKTLPKESTALPAQHQHLGELLTQSIFSPQAGIQLFPILGLSQGRL